MVLELALNLPVLTDGWAAEKDFSVVNRLTKSQSRSVEPVGPHFLAYARRKKHKRTFSEDERIQAAKTVIKVEENEDDDISEDEDPDMLLRDCKDWKNQDHYAVLGLSKFRWTATDDQIKRGHRKKVLRHHPDKKAASGNAHDDSFFKCIQKATEILTDPVRRRQFDSVDENANVPAPSKKQLKEGGDFYALWTEYFKAEGRFSKTSPVPSFGDADSSRDDVEGFYNFFYNFDSWRSFEYQDQDVPDDNENRDQKRQVEKKNQNARKKKKTEDTARLRRSVDDALASDERIKKFRKEGKKKNKKQLEREEEQARAQAAKEEEEAKKREAEAQAAAQLAELTSQKENAKKNKEAAKTAAKKNKRVIRTTVGNVAHFGGNSDLVTGDVDAIIAASNPDQLADLVAQITLSKNDGTALKSAYTSAASDLISSGSLKKDHVNFFKV